jgi:hypothetical protein
VGGRDFKTIPEGGPVRYFDSTAAAVLSEAFVAVAAGGGISFST